MQSRFLFVALTLLLALPPLGAARADDDAQQWEETDELPAVQNRKYRLEHEFDVGIGTLPTDPYTKGFVVTGGYTWHWTETWAFEGHFNWVFNFQASLRDKLENNFGQPTTKFRETKFFGQLGALFKPLYGKLSFLNMRQVYGELFLSLYTAVAQLEGGKKTEEEPSGRGKRIAIGPMPGFGLRGFITEYISVRFDFRWPILFTGGFLASGGSPFEVAAPLTLTLNVAFTTRSDL